MPRIIKRNECICCKQFIFNRQSNAVYCTNCSGYRSKLYHRYQRKYKKTRGRKKLPDKEKAIEKNLNK